jgi:Ca2+-binding EF-hand superfamily protein
MIKNKLKFQLGVLLILLLGLSAVNAQSERQRPKPPTYQQLLEELDNNKDGKLAVSEIKGSLKEMADEVDTNKNGFISEEELKKAPMPKRKERN